jgi:hypothetical protein
MHTILARPHLLRGQGVRRDQRKPNPIKPKPNPKLTLIINFIFLKKEWVYHSPSPVRGRWRTGADSRARPPLLRSQRPDSNTSRETEVTEQPRPPVDARTHGETDGGSTPWRRRTAAEGWGGPHRPRRRAAFDWPLRAQTLSPQLDWCCDKEKREKKKKSRGI